jgi:hypothetical protein
MQVRTLVSKAAPGPWTALTKIYARDAFLTALNDLGITPPHYVDLLAGQRRWLPLTIWYCGYQYSTPGRWTPVACVDIGHVRKREISMLELFKVDVAAGRIGYRASSSCRKNRLLQKQINELRSRLAILTSSNADAEQPRARPRAVMDQSTTALRKARPRPPFRGLAREACPQCGKRGHWARECPTAQSGTGTSKGRPEIQHAHRTT